MTKKVEVVETTDLKKFEERTPDVPGAVESENNFLAIFERIAQRPDFTVDMLKQLQEMQEHSLDRDAKREFNAAFTRAQANIKIVVAEEENKQTKSHYANLKAILVKSAPIYTAEGFSLMFYEGESPKETQKRVCVDIMHKAGHTEKRYGDFTIQTTGIQGSAMMTQIHGEGSAFSYGRRYLTCMIWNIPTGDDDDGNAAGVTDYITPEQQAEITEGIKETGYDKKMFLDWICATSIETITEAQYKTAIQGLKDIKDDQDKKTRT